MENGNINNVNVENLYYQPEVWDDGDEEKLQHHLDSSTKVTYNDYKALTEDFMTYRIDEDAIEIVESYGYPRKMVVESINKGEINHATASYYLLIHSTTE